MTRIPNYKALLRFFNERPDDVKNYFAHLSALIEGEMPYEIAIAYVFSRVELAQNRALYGGVVKIHRGNAEFAKRLMNFQHLTRDGFKEIFKNVFGYGITESTSSKLKRAEKTRDKVIHGKRVSENDLREAIADVLEYAELFNSEVNSVAGFKPFADMRGFKGRADSLDTRTTKWLMRGLGFGVKA